PNSTKEQERMTGDDVAYFEQRAAEEIEMAQRAADSGAIQSHYELANFYLDRIYGEGEPPGDWETDNVAKLRDLGARSGAFADRTCRINAS
ncbi:MAG: hypothetical protein ACXWU1_13555, partial [Allosphingosinicella sp.]